MAKYVALIGKRVEVLYRAGYTCLSATAVLVADGGKSIFLEDHVRQGEALKVFRWEIPEASIIRVSELGRKALASSSPAPKRATERESSWFLLPREDGRAEKA